MADHLKDIQRQFDLRAETFEKSVHWVTDKKLVNAHLKAAGPSKGKGLEMCCGTGVIARTFQLAGWDMKGVDISEEMVKKASQYIDATRADVEHLDFPDYTFDAIILRQAYFLLRNGPEVLKEVKRLLKPEGRFVISLTVPFSHVDTPWLKKIHETKQAQMVRFFIAEDLAQEIKDHGFIIEHNERVTVRESVTSWMKFAPEMNDVVRQKICDLIVKSPKEYHSLRHVEVVEDEILEDWNWVIYGAVVR